MLTDNAPRPLRKLVYVLNFYHDSDLNTYIRVSFHVLYYTNAIACLFYTVYLCLYEGPS